MRLRVLTAVAALVTAGVHLKLWVGGVREQGVVGQAFLLNVVAGVVIAVLLVTWQHWVPALLALGLGLSTLGAFVISATVGLFGVHEQWVSPFTVTAAVAEIVCVVGGLALLRRHVALHGMPHASGRTGPRAAH